MRQFTKIWLGLGAVVVLGGGLVWWGLRPSTKVSEAPLKPRIAGRTTAHQIFRHPSPSQKPSVPAKSTSTAAGSHGVALGTVAWATQLRAALSQQWGSAAPPLWVVPDPVQSGTWFALAPLAHDSALWWADATLKQPIPRFQSVSTSLHLTNAQIAALPKPLQGALNQAYDLIHDQPWPLTVHLPPIAANGAMTATQAEARGTARRPIGWRVIWDPAIPATLGQSAQPAAANFSIALPWQVTGYAPVLASEGMQWRTNGHLVSDGDVTIYMNGTTMQTVPVTDTAVLVPSSVSAGIVGPGSGG